MVRNDILTICLEVWFFTLFDNSKFGCSCSKKNHNIISFNNFEEEEEKKEEGGGRKEKGGNVFEYHC